MAKYKKGSVEVYQDQFWVSCEPTDKEPPTYPWQLSILHDDTWATKPGPPGKDGRDGNDSTVPGPAGRDSQVPGPAGRDGTGFRYRGEYRRTTEYVVNDVISDGDGSTYLCVQDCRGRSLENTNYFALWAARGERGQRGEQGGAGQRGRSSIALQNELAEQVAELSERIDELEIDGVTTGLAVFAVAASKGMAVRVEDDATVFLAVAQLENDYTKVNWQRACDGLALEDVEASNSGRYATDGILELDDWSAVAGTVHLDPGSNYMLSQTEPGKLTKWDSDAAYLMKQIIGKALNETQLDIEIKTAVYSNKRQAEFDASSLSGTIVYESSDGHVDKAIADNLATATAIGLTYGNPSAGHIGEYYIHGPIIAPDKDWTDSTGSPELTPGPYYLSDSDPGMMTNVEPTTPGNYRVKLGEATDSNTFFVKIEPPVLIT